MGSLYGKNDYESMLILPNAHMVSRFRKFASGIVTTSSMSFVYFM